MKKIIYLCFSLFCFFAKAQKGEDIDYSEYSIDSFAYKYLAKILPDSSFGKDVYIGGACFRHANPENLSPYKDVNVFTYQSFVSMREGNLKSGWSFGTPMCTMLFDEKGILSKIFGENDYKELSWFKKGGGEIPSVFKIEIVRLINALQSSQNK